MKKTLLIVTSLLISGSISIASAEDNKDKDKGEWHGKKFEKLDTNKDGTVTKEEFMSSHEERFNRMDANKDGKITPEEAKEHRETMKEKFKEMKKDRKE